MGKGDTRKAITVPIAKTRFSFRATRPETFQLGDIVEVQVSFVGVPLRGSKWKISIVLRSISLFEGRFTQVNMEYTLRYRG